MDILNVTRLNTQSFRKHLDHILIDKNLLSNAIIDFTETQLELRENQKI